MVSLPSIVTPGWRVLSDADRARIADAVRQAESGTSAEIVVAIETQPCEETDATIALIAAGFLAIFLAWPLSLLGASLHVGILAQAALFACLAALASSTRVRSALGIGLLPSAAARKAARRAFDELGLARTRERTGVLIHVALADRHVEIIADEGVHEAVAPRTWDEIVDRLVAAARQGHAVDGVVEAVGRCGAALADVLPPQPGLGDELPNEPVTR